MKYGIKCITDVQYNGFIKTNRGWEAWGKGYNEQGKYGVFEFDNINEAYRNLQNQWFSSASTKYYVEELERI